MGRVGPSIGDINDKYGINEKFILSNESIKKW